MHVVAVYGDSTPVQPPIAPKRFITQSLAEGWQAIHHKRPDSLKRKIGKSPKYCHLTHRASPNLEGRLRLPLGEAKGGRKIITFRNRLKTFGEPIPDFRMFVQVTRLKHLSKP